MIITTAWDDAMQPCADVTVPRMEAYCKKHGHTFVRSPVVQGMTPQWSKVSALIELVKPVVVHYNNPTQVTTDFAWLDVDMLITNMAKDFPFGSYKPLTFGTDINGLNAGVIVIDAVYHAGHVLRTLEAWLAMEPRFKHHVSPEQTALAYMLVTLSRWKWKVLAQRKCNSYLYNLYNMEHKPGQWRKGDFILHVPALPIDQRAEILQQYTQYY